MGAVGPQYKGRAAGGMVLPLVACHSVAWAALVRAAASTAGAGALAGALAGAVAAAVGRATAGAGAAARAAAAGAAGALCLRAIVLPMGRRLGPCLGAGAYLAIPKCRAARRAAQVANIKFLKKFMATLARFVPYSKGHAIKNAVP